ncbi:MAG: hypothetical protein FJ118_04155 [Deltaproteobacteria bacterium]|nr:hypothetical protein [Deltaproteobacteria bacterium]
MAARNTMSRRLKGLTAALAFLGVCCIGYAAFFGTADHLRLLDVAVSAAEGAPAGTAAESQPKSSEELEKAIAQLAAQGGMSPAYRQLFEQTLELVKKAESRSLETKMMSMELISLLWVAIVVLVFIALSFPLSLWLLSKWRLIGLSGLSSEVAATLVLVEERQAKLVNILKDIQGEIDYLHTMSVPDLKKLVEQAEKYIEQNERDLAGAGVPRTNKPK